MIRVNSKTKRPKTLPHCNKLFGNNDSRTKPLNATRNIATAEVKRYMSLTLILIWGNFEASQNHFNVQYINIPIVDIWTRDNINVTIKLIFLTENEHSY